MSPAPASPNPETALTLAPIGEEDFDAWRTAALARFHDLRVTAGTHETDAATETAGRILARHLADGVATASARLARVRRGDTTVGTVWLDVQPGGLAMLFDVVLDDPGRDGAGVRALVEAEARAAGCTDLDVLVFAADASQSAFVAGGSFTPKATHMSLDLTTLTAPDPGVELAPMTRERFDEYHEQDIEGYARERHESGMGPLEEQRELAREEFAALLPDGVDTEGQCLWSAFRADDSGPTEVGILWIQHAVPASFVYNVVVDEDLRGQGRGRAIMTAGARWCRDHGSETLGLNVFGPNATARALYDSLGYVVTDALLTTSL